MEVKLNLLEHKHLACAWFGFEVKQKAFLQNVAYADVSRVI